MYMGMTLVDHFYFYAHFDLRKQSLTLDGQLYVIRISQDIKIMCIFAESQLTI